jgi:hypothetical protein
MPDPTPEQRYFTRLAERDEAWITYRETPSDDTWQQYEQAEHELSAASREWAERKDARR